MPKPVISIKILSSDARLLGRIPKNGCTGRAVPRFFTGQEAAAQSGTARVGSRCPASGSMGPGQGVPAAALRPRVHPGLRHLHPRGGRWEWDVRAGSRTPLNGGKQGEIRPRKQPGEEEGGVGKLAASSRPRLRSPLLSCPKSSRLQKIFVCTISLYWS